MLKVAVLILPLFLVACGDAKATAGAEARKPTDAAAAAPNSPATAGNPSVTGTVLETMDAGAYTYVRMKTSEGEIWAAVNQSVLKPGASITIENAMWMENFESKTLNRKFETILFGTLAGAGDAAALPPGHPPTASAAAASADAGDMLGDVKVDKATGKDGRTVAEVWADRIKLDGVEVVVRAKVVK